MRLEPSELSHFLAGERATFGMSPNAFGLYCAVGVLGLLFLARRFCGARQNRTFSVLRVLAWVAVMIILVQGLIFSQSRGAWLATMIVFPPLLLIHFLVRLRADDSGVNKRAACLAILVVIVTAWLIVFNRDVIKNRILFELDSFEAIAASDLTNLSPDAYGLRVLWWRLGIEKWMERPFFG